MPVKTIDDLDRGEISGKRILVRVDFNVPLDDGRITDDTRISRALPTLVHLLERGGRVVVMSHLGRPKGKANPDLSLEPVARHLRERLDFPVTFSSDLVGDEAREAARGLEDGELLLLENTRFHPGETQNDPELAEQLADLGEVYVNDAFGTAHRAHASTVGVAEALRERGCQAVAGFLMEKEMEYLDRSLQDPGRPFVAILGGAKISGKIDVIQALLPRVDRLLIGGAMANTFFKALGLEVGESLVEEDRVELARSTLEEAGDKLLLPVDCVVADEIAPDAGTRVVARSEVGGADGIGDVGPETRDLFVQELEEARTVVWNGPMGVFEMEPFAQGTLAVARGVAGVTRAGGTTIVGGGDSASAVEKAGVANEISHVSTGGGASLELLSGAELPGLAALDREEGEAT